MIFCKGQEIFGCSGGKMVTGPWGLHNYGESDGKFPLNLINMISPFDLPPVP